MSFNPSGGPALSIVIATIERPESLKSTITAVRSGLRATHEIIIVGEHDDALAQWMATNPDLKFVEEPRREGAARAYNLGFAAARGRFVLWLHDDARPRPGAIDAALKMIRRPDYSHAGCVALFESGKGAGPSAETLDALGRTYSVAQLSGVTVATFGVMRRELLAQLKFLDERYYTTVWQKDLALKIRMESRLATVCCRDALVEHDEMLDERKRTERAMVQRDLERLETKWELSKNTFFPPLTVPAVALCASAAASLFTVRPS